MYTRGISELGIVLGQEALYEVMVRRFIFGKMKFFREKYFSLSPGNHLDFPWRKQIYDVKGYF